MFQEFQGHKALILTLLFMTITTVLNASPTQTLFEGVERYELDNGLTVLLKPSQKADTVSIYLGLKAGSSDEGDRIGSGLAHFVEHMFFKGTARRPVGSIEKEIRDMGGYINAYTSHDVTVFYVNALAGYLEQALDLMSDAAFHSEFVAGELEKEREVILSEMRMNEDKLDRKTLTTLWQLTFRKHPYRHPVIGYPELFKRVTREDLLAYYHENYVPNQLVLSVAGRIDSDKTKKLIDKFFADKPRGWAGPQAKPQEPRQLAPRKTVLYKEAEHARLHLGFPTVELNHPDSPALDVLGTVMGGGTSSRFNQAVKENKDLALQIGSFNASMDEHGLFIIQSVVTTDKVDAVRDAIREETDRVKEDLISEEELSKAKNQFLSDFYHSFESHSSMAREIMSNQIYTGEYRFSENYVRLIEALSAEDIRQVARKYFDWNRVNEALLLPLESEQNAKAVPTSTEAADNISVTQLPNGLKVLVGQDKTSPTVILQYAMRGGVLYEKESESGISVLTAKLLTKGTAQYDQAQISRMVELWGGSIDRYSGLNSLGVNISALSAYTEDSLKLLAQVIKESSFPEDQIAKAKERQIQAILAKEENIFGFAQDLLLENMYPKHPYRRDPLGTEESVSSISREQITAFYGRVLNPQESVVSVMGDIDKSQVETWIQEAFGDLKPHEPEPNDERALDRIDGLKSVRTHLPREQSVVMVGFNATRLDDPRRYAYEVLNASMSGSSGRLYRNIREKEGLSYVVNSDVAPAVDPGWFAFYASVEPGQADRTLDLMKKEVLALRKSGLTTEEIEGAKQRLKGAYEKSRESKYSQLSSLSSHELYGLGFQTWLDYPQKIDAVTARDVGQIIKEFVDSNHCVELIVEPGAKS